MQDIPITPAQAAKLAETVTADAEERAWVRIASIVDKTATLHVHIPTSRDFLLYADGSIEPLC